MPAGLKRYYGKGHLHFITFSCYRRLPLLKTVRARDIFVQELGRVRDETEFRLIGYVVMPEHVHLLMSEPKRGTPSTVLQKLKLRVSRKLRKRRKFAGVGQLQLPFEEEGGLPRAFWQPRFYDFNVYTKGKKTEKLNYMHANPVTRRLMKLPRNGHGAVGPFTPRTSRGWSAWTLSSRKKRSLQDPGSNSEPGAPSALLGFVI
jgi:putative transposase